MKAKKPKLSPADEKFIAKFFPNLDFSTDTITRTNPFTGLVVEIDPISAAAFDFALKVYKIYSGVYDNGFSVEWGNEKLKEIHPSLKMTNLIQNYDRSRFLMLKLNGRAYSKLLD